VSLCSFTFADGRRCRTPRAAKNARFCFYHAQKEARARAAETLGKDLAYFFSGNYLSACDLSTTLARLIPAVVRGDVKPKTAHTVAYLIQTLMQAIHVSQHEYCEAFSSDAWRKSIRNSVNDNYDYRLLPAPEPNQPESPQPQAQPQPQPRPQPAQPPASPSPTTRFTARRNARKLSFRADRGIYCFRIAARPATNPTPTTGIVTTYALASDEGRIRPGSGRSFALCASRFDREDR
jgi:hypothetical protein